MEEYIETRGIEALASARSDDKTKYEIVLRGTKKSLIEALKTLYFEDCIECNHEITHYEGVDDDLYFDAYGNLQERSNPDIEVCDICEKSYNTEAEEWQY